MRVLFLDIDGVLNSHRSFVANNFEKPDFGEDDGYIVRAKKRNKQTIDPICVRLLDILCQELDLKLVLSSSHRNLVVDSEVSEAENIQRVKDYVKFLGVETEVVGYTPFVKGSNSQRRGLEISEWLRANHINQYVIVDDYDQFLPYQQPFFSITNQVIGFSTENMEEIKKMFGIEWYPNVFL